MPVTVKITASDIDDDANEPGVRVEIVADGDTAAQEACDAFQTVCDRLEAYIDGNQKTEATPAADKPPV